MAMKLKFIEQSYQTEAVKQVVDCFEGCEIKNSEFTIVQEDSTHLFSEIGYGNKCSLTDEDFLKNIQKVQERFDGGTKIQKITTMDNGDYNCPNLTVEMETGTGKTYVYTKTILELNKKYGFTKFIIVVPSVAIKEGVFKSLQVTQEHFNIAFSNPTYDYFVYDSNKIGKIKAFASSSTIQIMVMTIAAFNKTVESQDDETKANLIFRPSDKLDGWTGIQLIRETRPIVIIDEPQSVDSSKDSKKAVDAIKQLEPLAILRYSATHKKPYNIVYRLTPVDAYQQHLVKEIYVDEVTADEETSKAYVKLIGITSDGINVSSNRARIEIFVNDKKTGVISKKTVTAKTNDDIWDLSNEVDYYNGGAYTISYINADKDNLCIGLDTGDELFVGGSIGEVDDEAIKRGQIRETIKEHLNKERTFIAKGIKVLSLFFIDKVENYREKEDGEPGKYYKWFEEEYNDLINSPAYKSLRESKVVPSGYFDVKNVHNGYFSSDGKGRNLNTDGNSTKDDTTYNLIMKKKEDLLSFSTPIRFIFSHSALKEGWDNPNVFQVCTLIETKDTFTKRQKIGRGLRICVNQTGDRVLEPNYNYLTVIANESYKEFCATLQKEFAENGYKFGLIEPTAFTGLKIVTNGGNEKELSQDDSVKIHTILQQKGYIDNKDKPTEKFYLDKKEGNFNINETYRQFDNKVAAKIEELATAGMPKNAKEKVKINRNNKVINSEIFIDIWNRINQKTIYSVNIPIEEMKELAIEYISNMPTIKEIKIGAKKVKIDIKDEGVSAQDGGATTKEVAKLNEYESYVYPDFIRRLTDATQLLRTTIIDILVRCGRFSDFYKNPEQFIKQVSDCITKAKKEKLVDGIQYEKVEEFYKQEEIFDDTELFGIKDKNVVDVSKPDKNPFDHIIFDSQIEKAFAKDCDEDDDVLLYAKLPSRFKVDTPFGGYNPDWMVVIKTGDEEAKLYFVAETKANPNINDLRPDEQRKIHCGTKHFEVLNKEINYKVVKELLELKE